LHNLVYMPVFGGPPSLTVTSSSLLGIECTRFLKYWLSSFFWVWSLTISLWQPELGPNGAEGYTCSFDFISVVFGGGLDDQRHSKTELT
jgi:hypothetical protein